MDGYRRLNAFEREEISLWIAKGRSRREIAAWLSRSPSTISREISRNTEYGEHYRALHAQSHSNILSHTTRKKRKLDINEPLKQYVFKQLEQFWSPESRHSRDQTSENIVSYRHSYANLTRKYLLVFICSSAWGITQRIGQMLTAPTYKPPYKRQDTPENLSYTGLYKH